MRDAKLLDKILALKEQVSAEDAVTVDQWYKSAKRGFQMMELRDSEAMQEVLRFVRRELSDLEHDLLNDADMKETERVASIKLKRFLERFVSLFEVDATVQLIEHHVEEIH